MRGFFIFLTLSLAISGCRLAAQPANTRQIIDDARQSGLPTLVEFGAARCKSCRDMKPILDAVAKQLHGQAHVVTVDLSQDYGLAGDYKIRIMPTLIFYDQYGHETRRHIGAMSQTEILIGLGFSAGD